MNGHTYMRNYRVLMLLGMVSFFATAYLYSVPQDFNIEEYLFFDSGALPSSISRTVLSTHPSTLCRTELLPISQKSTATTCTK